MSILTPCRTAAAVLLLSTAPLHAQDSQEGLVNINVEDNTVQVPVGVAAAVCPDVDANVLAQQFAGTNEIACEIDQETAAENNIGGGSPGGGEQNGLVNVDVDGNTIQIPVGVAATVCPDVDANVLARQFVGSDEIACEIDQETAAENNLPGFADAEAADEAPDTVEETADAAENSAEDLTEGAQETAEDAANGAAEVAEDAAETVEDAAGEVEEAAEEASGG